MPLDLENETATHWVWEKSVILMHLVLAKEILTASALENETTLGINPDSCYISFHNSFDCFSNTIYKM